MSDDAGKEALTVEEKYEYNGWPSLARPDLKAPDGWSLPLITGVNRVRNHRLSPDGRQIAFIWDREDLSDVYVMSAGGGWPRRISMERAPVAYWSDETPQWSTDGQWLAFTMKGHVHVAPLSGGLPQRISDFAAGAFSPVWMPDSRRLLVSVEREDSTQLLLTDREGRWPRALVADSGGDVWDARPAPDGQHVAFTFRPFSDLKRLDVRLLSLETGQVRTLAGEPGVRTWQARWSPDGRTLAYLSQASGYNEVWLARPDGEGRRQLSHIGADVGEFAWSPDGQRLACTVNRGGAFDLALLDVSDGALTDVKTGKGIYAQLNWTPDGEGLTVAYEDWSQPPDLYRVSLPGGDLTQLTFSNPPALQARRLVQPERVSYRSYDGLEIPAFLYRPQEPNGAVVVYPHGGPSAQYLFEWDILAQYLVAKGYTYLCPNYRGSTGYGIDFEHANYGDWGQGDAQDCLHAARYARELPGIDPQRLAIYGSSYGGYMVACCLARDPDYLYACGVSKYGDANLMTSWAQCNRDLRLYTEIFLGHPRHNRQVFEAGSPIRDVHNIEKPVLLLHGLLDDVVPPQASEEWADAMRRADKVFEYKTYAGEPHGFLKRATQLDAYRRIERFLDWHLVV
ncbi:MAG TPA: S9 family peptidase [Candidatus Sulfomarinibacteraceae bacterium]|nr:S9 family peptidase [Candidatus Sulfomarinibacteraceae bacterium]